MEHQRNSKAPSSLLPGVLDHLGLANTSATHDIPAESLIIILDDVDWHKRANAVSALEEHPTSIPLTSLLSALHDEDVSVRAAAVYALGRCKGQSALPYISDALHDSEWLVREAAILTLGDLGEQASTGQIIASLDDGNEFVREAAQIVLTQNEHFYFDDPDDYAAGDNVLITSLDPSTYASRSRRLATFRLQPRRLAAIGLHHATAARLQPHRLAAGILTGLVVIVLLASWLVLIPALRSSRSESGNPSPHPATVLFSAHYQGGAFLPQWTPDGKHMAFVDDYGNMYAWDSSTKKLSRTFTLPYLTNPDAPANWSWTSDGRHIVSYDYNTAVLIGQYNVGATIQLWDALTGQRVFSITARSSAWADDGSRIAIVDEQNTLQIRNMDTGQVQLTIASAHFQKISCVAWSPDGRMIATSSNDGTVEIWDAATGNKLQSFSDLGKASQSAQDITFISTVWSPDSSRVITARAENNSAYRSLQIWDVTSGRKLLTFSNHTALPFMEQWFSDGKRILSASANETLIWDAANGHVLANIPNNRSQYPGTPVLSPDEKWLAFSNATQTIQIWNTSTGREVFTYRGHSANVITSSIAWSPDSAYISSADIDGNILVWQAGTGKLIFKYKLDFFLPSQYIPTHLAFLVWSPDGRMLALASDEGTIAVLQAT